MDDKDSAVLSSLVLAAQDVSWIADAFEATWVLTGGAEMEVLKFSTAGGIVAWLLSLAMSVEGETTFGLSSPPLGGGYSKDDMVAAVCPPEGYMVWSVFAD